MACKRIRMTPVYSPLYELSEVLFYSQLWKTFRCVSTSSHLFTIALHFD